MNSILGYRNILYNTSLQIEDIPLTIFEYEQTSELISKDFLLSKSIIEQDNDKIDMLKNGIIETCKELDNISIIFLNNNLTLYKCGHYNITYCISMAQSTEWEGINNKTNTERFFDIVKELKAINNLHNIRIGSGLASIISQIRNDYKRWYGELNRSSYVFRSPDPDEHTWYLKFVKKIEDISDNKMIRVRPLYGNIIDTIKHKHIVKNSNIQSLFKFKINNIDITNMIII